MVTNYTKHARKIKSGIVVAKATLKREKNFFTRKLDLNLRKTLVKCYTRSVAMYGGGIWTLWKVDQRYLESLEIWSWRRMEKIIWTDHMDNEEVLHSVKEVTSDLPTMKRKKVTWNSHILSWNCLLKHLS
jgi:hypothetical protein